MTTFALVHGGYHGAWCWERLTPLLQQAGDDVVTMDLPLDDGTATFDTYADVVCAALDGCDDDVVLVGHSYAGNTIPLVAARRPLRHLVFLCAMIPDIGRSLAEQLGDKPEMLNPAYEQGIERARRAAAAGMDRPRPRAARCSTATATNRSHRLRSAAFGRSRPIRLSFRSHWPNTQVCQRHTSCAATTKCCGRSGQDKWSASGSPPSSSRCRGAIRRCCLGPQIWPMSCSGWRTRHPSWRAAGRRSPAGRCRLPGRGRAR